MKKWIYGVAFILISASIIMVICIKNIKNEEENTNTNINDNTNEFSIVPTFKSENIDRYKLYKESHSNLDINEIVKNVNLDLDFEFYDNTHQAINEYTNLVLANKYYKLDENYVPKNLVNLSTYYASNSNIYADEEAYTHFKDLCNDASILNLTIKTISAYRAYSYQEALYNKYLKSDPQEIVDTYSARAGHSEHQTGLAFDVYNTVKPYTDFGNTNEFEWLKDNAHNYGFIIRYNKENEYITGYKNEPWHIRYVGIPAASTIYNKNITLEEYLLNS